MVYALVVILAPRTGLSYFSLLFALIHMHILLHVLFTALKIPTRQRNETDVFFWKYGDSITQKTFCPKYRGFARYSVSARSRNSMNHWVFTIGQTSPNFFFLPVKLNVSVTIKRQTVVCKVKGPCVYANCKGERHQNAHSDKLHVWIFIGELSSMCDKEAKCQLMIDQRSYGF